MQRETTQTGRFFHSWGVMRFRTLLLLVFIVLLEIYFIASRLGVPIDVIVQFATFIALIFPLYSWEKERLHNRYALVDK